MFTVSLRVLCCLILASLFIGGGCSSGERKDSESEAENQEATGKSAESETAPGADLPVPDYETGICRIYGGDEESIVLVNGDPARDAEGHFLSPPCEVRVARGNCTITLSRKGYQDFSRIASVSETSEVDFPALQPAAEFSVTTVSAPLFDLEPGVPHRFETVNSPGAELDPWLSPDGLTLWFAGDRSEGKAIYRATRPSVWHEFTEPEALLLSRSPTLPASPSVTADDLTVYYAAPEDGRIWRLFRDDIFDRFTEKEVALISDRDSVSWTSTLVTPDNLRLYWTELAGQTLKGFAAVRQSPQDKFSRPIEFPLPGLFPVLSSDGLRQYVFDGSSLARARRASLSDSFHVLLEIQLLSLPNFEAQPNRRQFFVSENEQWLVYSLGDVTSADLWIVRLSRDPGWGVIPIGKRIPPRPPVMASVSTPDPSGASTPAKTIDPRTIPLPVAVYRETWLRHLAQREYDQALELSEKALSDSALAESRALLQEDLAIVEKLKQFWTLAEFAFGNLEEGRPLALGSARAVFQKYDRGIVSMTLGGKSVERPLRELPASTVSTIVEASLDKADSLGRGQLAHFLLFDEGGRASIAFSRVKDYPQQREELLKHASGADLHLAQQELDRDNLVAGFRLLQQVIREYPDSPAFEQAKELERQLYEKTDWQITGNRKWETGEGGEYRADRVRVENSFLRSPRTYKNFELHFEWMTFGGLGQGGVYFNYSGEGRVFNGAFKIHLASDHLAAPDAYSSGSLFGIAAPTENTVKPEGEWNQCRIVVRDGDVEVFINDKKVLDSLALSDEIPEEGYILFDGITGGIAYRHILLMETPSGLQ
ncbi:MAG TPA: DUF1080 domain-containing protein [Planctomycetaceae bacterium]|nr:DUF1080 domain-containing protein [Planctomycetaceae bacterium]